MEVQTKHSAKIERPIGSGRLVQRAVLAIALGIAAGRGLRADTVVLRSGEELLNVRVRPSGAAHTIYFPDGSRRRIANAQIRSIRSLPTSWEQSAQRPPAAAIQPAPAVTAPAGPLEPALQEMPATGRNLTPIIQSAIWPGWGQYSEGRELHAAVYAIGAGFLLERYWRLRQRHSAAEADYNDPAPTGAVAFQTLNGRLSILQAATINVLYLASKERTVFALEKETNNTAIALSLLWAWNLVDIVFGGPPWQANWPLISINRAPSLHWRLSAGPGTVVACLQIQY
ncbi:MAG: hypothetical protein K1X75_04000 [Leptospirales bacterium]|nr:hypothetical protein [Leptospirales bacterium]